MSDEETRDQLRKMITFGINRTAILYNQERLTKPDKYDFWYQWDHLWFQVRRARDPGFFRNIFSLSHKSPNFISNRLFITKAVLRDLCIGRFNTIQLSGTVDLESVHKKNKSGNYDPRHARRRLNEELRELVRSKGRLDSDERKISYSTAFTIDPKNSESALDNAKEMWETEINGKYTDQQTAISRSRPIFLKEIFPERWEDLIAMQKKMLEIIGSFEYEITSSRYFSALKDEISSFSHFFVILSNHINSISEIFWFMKKDRKKRTSLLVSQSPLTVELSDVEQSLSLMKYTGWNAQEVVLSLFNVPDALISFGFVDLALELLVRLMNYDSDGTMAASVGLEYVAILRKMGKYDKMLALSTSVLDKYGPMAGDFTYALLKIRNAEALALNGRREEAVEELEQIFQSKGEYYGTYIPYGNEMKQVFDFVINEKETPPGSGTVPIRVSLLENLITAALRIKEYCLVKKYLEELFDTEADYFKREDSMQSFLNLNQLYNEMIFKCK